MQCLHTGYSEWLLSVSLGQVLLLLFVSMHCRSVDSRRVDVSMCFAGAASWTYA